MKFEKKNLNPKNIKAGDCVIRAIAYASDKSWEDVYKSLCDIGLKMKRVPNEKAVYERYLADNGWVKRKQPLNYFDKKMTIEDFMELSSIKNTKIIFTISGHMTVVNVSHFDCELVDTWNCSRKCVCNYWVKD